MAFLETKDPPSVAAGLEGLYAMCSKYEFKLYEMRGPLDDIVLRSYPVLGLLINDMMNNSGNEDALRILHLISKIFYRCNQYIMCHCFYANTTMLEPWISFFKTVLELPVPPELAAPTEYQFDRTKRNKCILWKIKGRIAKLTFRMIIEYGDPSIFQNNMEAKSFANAFKALYMIPLLEAHMKILFSRKDQFVGDKCLLHVIRYIKAACCLPRSLEKIKPYSE